MLDYGEKISFNSFISMTDADESGAGQMELYYRFDRIMNTEDIISITIGNETISLT